MAQDFLGCLRSRVLVLDGAMGTMLLEKGLLRGELPERWNLTHPELVQEVHLAYLEAGCDIIETNTFGANHLKLKGYGLENQSAKLSYLGARLAREACREGCFVAGSIGPVGGQMAKANECFESFKEQAQALAQGGVDLILVETMTDVEEACLAVSAAGATGLPTIVSMVFERGENGYRALGGISLEEAAVKLLQAGADGLGCNCLDPGVAGGIIESLKKLTDCFLIAQPHAGLPQLREGRLSYPIGPEAIAEQYRTILAAQPDLVGGCCGTTPAHIARLVQVVRRRIKAG